MNLRAVTIYIGHILRLEGVFMIPALAVSLWYRETPVFYAFFTTVALLLAVGTAMARTSSNDYGLYAREGFVTVALGWILLSLFGALPFYFSKTIPGLIDCWFESVSGFTTTSASIIKDVEALPRGILYWRSFTNWLGGMGVLVFMLALLPHSRDSGQTLHLVRAEIPGPSVGKLSPTVRSTTRILYGIYIVLTAVEIIMLLLGGMGLFDATTHAFATAGTGGFSTMNKSIAAFDSRYISSVITVFMMLFGINFGFFHLVLIGKAAAAFKSEEFRAYLGVILFCTAAVAVNIHKLYAGFSKALADALFQVISIITTTGFVTADFDLWPQFSRYLLLGLMIVGASSGSTGGGVKIMRLLIMGKVAKSEVLTLAHPRAVSPPRIDGKKIDDGVIRGTYAFMTVYAAICVVSMAAVALDNFSFEVAVSAVLASINNVGIGLGAIGPMSSFACLSPLSKTVLTFDMLFGRLEIFPMLMLFSKEVWKR